MNPHSACASFHATRYSRRHMLKVGGLGMLGLSLPKLLQGADTGNAKAGTRNTPKARAKSVIFLYQFGGPSHLDMFDMKPDAPEAIRGPYKPIGSNADGIQVSERMPR